MENCIFCKIIKGEIPAAIVYENDHVLAILDISQVTKGHTLVIPKQHVQDVFELTPELIGEIYKVVPEVACKLKKAFQPAGLNLLNNNGEFAGQTVFHYHVHLIPRYDQADGFGIEWTPNANADLAAVTTQIQSQQ